MMDVKVNGDLEAWADAAVRAAVGATETSVGLTIREVYTDAKQRWPVRPANRSADHPRGYSKARLAQSVTADADGATGRIANDSGYTFFIRSKRVDLPSGSTVRPTRNDGKVHVWTALVREPAERASVGLRDRIRSAILKAIEGVR